MLEWIVKNPQNKIGKPSQLFLWHGRRKTWPIHFIDARLFIDRTDFHRQGKIWRWKNKIKINIICKKKSPLSMENLLWLWNVLSMKCPIYEMSYLWNVLSMKYLSMKCPIYEISFYEMSNLWNVPTPKFCVRPHLTPRECLWMLKITKTCVQKFWTFRKSLKMRKKYY